MKNLIYLVIVTLLIILPISILAQHNNFELSTSIRSDGIPPDSSAILDVQSTEHGILIPRMTTIQMNSIHNPAIGLILFVTDDNHFYYWNSSAWSKIEQANDSGWTVNTDTIYSAADSTITIKNKKVGIGIVNPVNDLDIMRESRYGIHPENLPLYITAEIGPDFNGMEIRHTNGSQGIGLGYNTIYASGSNTDQDITIKSRGNGDIHLKTGITDVMHLVASTTHVGIGTSAPASKLHVIDTVFGTTNFVARIENTSTHTEFHNGLLIQAGHSNWAPGNHSRFIEFKKPDGTTIGTVNQVNNSSVAYATTSDKRLKDNIQSTQYGLADLLKIKVMDYQYKGDISSQRQTGFIAQQLYTTYPQAVQVGGDDPKTEPWQVAYGSLTPLLVQAIQELADQNKVLEAKLDKQQQQIKWLMDKFEEMNQ
jgi:hypothetical protein